MTKTNIVSLIFISICSICIFSSFKNKDEKKIEKEEHTLNLSSGTVDRIKFESVYVDPRNIDIWLPPTYDGKKKHAVLYMHDGAMLYDASHSWNHAEWEVDETIGSLLQQGKIKDVIVVGIWNNGHKRHLEYFPQQAIDSISEPTRTNLLGLMPEVPQGDNYLKFIVEELKPYIDRTYSVKTDRNNTFISGSSMGGLISLYAICEYPEVFGKAACLSTHWIGTFDNNTEIPEGLFKYLENHLPNPKTHKIYFDLGTEGLDANYPEHQKVFDTVMQKHGYRKGKNWETIVFEGHTHSEADWSKRLHIPMEFILK